MSFIVVWISERCSWPSECAQCACRQWRMYKDQWLWSVVPCTKWPDLPPAYQKRIWVSNRSCVELRFLDAFHSTRTFDLQCQEFPIVNATREHFSNYGQHLTGNFWSIWFPSRKFWNFLWNGSRFGNFLSSQWIFCEVWACMHRAHFSLFCKNICYQFWDTRAHGDFFRSKFCQALPNLRRAGMRSVENTMRSRVFLMNFVMFGNVVKCCLDCLIYLLDWN